MGNNKRLALALGVLVLLGALALGGRAYMVRAPGAATDALDVEVTSAEDLGPGSLREALFIAAAAAGKARISIKTRRIVLKSQLPALMNPHGMQIVAEPPNGEIDAQALAAGPVFDVIAANTVVEGLVLRNCPAAAIQVRAAHFQLQASTIDSCDIGVDVAANASDSLIEQNRFANNRIGVRFVAPSPETVLTGNTFDMAKEAGLWAVRGDTDPGTASITVRQNRFTGNHAGLVAGNIAILVDDNDFTANAPDAAVHLVGAGAAVRGNHFRGAGNMGLVAENAREARIEGNDFAQLDGYAIMVRSSADAQLRSNRIDKCGYGIAFVLGDAGHPGIAMDNTIVEPAYHGIDVIGDSPILRHNQVLRPHALAMHVTGYRAPDGQTVRSQPLMDGNNFRADALQTAAESGAGQESARRE
jgi:hypothetical protein